LHFDLSKSTEKEKDEAYYTVQEAMKKYNMTRDSVYNTLSFHQIKREKKGRFVKFLKVDFDRVMGVKK
jgi:DNA-binding protein H-NS